MSDFTARLGMLRGSMPTVASGGSRRVRLRIGEMIELNQAAVPDALRANLDFDATTLQQPRAAFKALRRVARATEQAVRHGDPDEFARPAIDCLRPLADMPPNARPTRAEIDAVINRPGATRLWNRATWQLIAALTSMVRSNWGAIDVVLRIDAINRRTELGARGSG